MTIPAQQWLPPPGALFKEIQVYWMDAHLVRQGIIPFTKFEADIYYNAVGSWQLTAPYSEELWHMTQSGDVIVEVDWQGLFTFGGKCETPGYSDTLSSSGGGAGSGPMITMAGADYLALIANRIAYPNPTIVTGWAGQTAGAADAVANMPCENAIKHYVDRNIGPSAILPRRHQLLDILPNRGQGSPVSYRVAFQQGADYNLMDLIRTLVSNSTVPIGVVLYRDGLRLKFDAYVPVDRSNTAYFSEDLGNLTAVDLTIADPTVTNSLAQGRGTAASDAVGNYFYEEWLHNPQPTQWNRVEDYLDQSSQADNAQVRASALAALGGGSATPSLKVTTVDIPLLTFGRDYYLGDIVTVQVRDGVRYTDIVSSVHLVADPTQNPPIQVTPTVGAPSSSTTNDQTVISKLAAKVHDLERQLDRK